ncbi:hypothetical protein FACS1894188_07640 [Clostridia bacterium]|nr:hypothetical protein FACS1894188_07640 [Clostridia bacterium]
MDITRFIKEVKDVTPLDTLLYMLNVRTSGSAEDGDNEAFEIIRDAVALPFFEAKDVWEEALYNVGKPFKQQVRELFTTLGVKIPDEIAVFTTLYVETIKASGRTSGNFVRDIYLGAVDVIQIGFGRSLKLTSAAMSCRAEFDLYENDIKTDYTVRVKMNSDRADYSIDLDKCGEHISSDWFMRYDAKPYKGYCKFCNKLNNLIDGKAVGIDKRFRGIPVIRLTDEEWNALFRKTDNGKI